MLASDSGLPLRPEDLAKEEQHSLLTPARLSDRKAWPRRNDARFRLRPASPTRRPGQGGMTLAFDSGPHLRPGVHRTPAYSSSPIDVVGAN